jgi:hypothetical protein
MQGDRRIYYQIPIGWANVLNGQLLFLWFTLVDYQLLKAAFMNPVLGFEDRIKSCTARRKPAFYPSPGFLIELFPHSILRHFDTGIVDACFHFYLIELEDQKS